METCHALARAATTSRCWCGPTPRRRPAIRSLSTVCPAPQLRVSASPSADRRRLRRAQYLTAAIAPRRCGSGPHRRDFHARSRRREHCSLRVPAATAAAGLRIARLRAGRERAAAGAALDAPRAVAAQGQPPRRAGTARVAARRGLRDDHRCAGGANWSGGLGRAPRDRVVPDGRASIPQRTLRLGGRPAGPGVSRPMRDTSIRGKASTRFSRRWRCCPACAGGSWRASSRARSRSAATVRGDAEPRRRASSSPG